MKNLSEFGFDNYAVTDTGAVYSLKSNRFLSIQYSDGGYATVTMSVNSKTKTVKVHRLVAMAYLDGYSPEKLVNHKDGNRRNNNVSNLEWVSRSENVRHALDTGLRPRTLSDEDVHIVCRLLQSGARSVDVAEITGFEKSFIQKILNRQNYTHVSCDYDFSILGKSQKISTKNILKICELLSLGNKVPEIAEQTEISSVTIGRIKRREIHTHLSQNFSW